MIINLPKIGPVRFADDISPEEFQSQLDALSKKFDFKLPKPDVGIGTLLGRGFMRGLGETGIAFGDVLPAMGASALGFDDYAKRQMDEATASRAELEKKYPTQFKSYTEVSSPFEALQYGAETLGELGPTALTALIPGIGAEAVGARLAGASALRAAQAAGPVSRAGLAAVEKAAETAGRRAMYGGVYFGSLSQNVPEVFQSIYQETGKMEPGIAALAGGLSAVLDSVVPGQMLDSLGAYGKLKVIEKLAKESGAAPKVWKYIAKEAATTAGKEGLTESAQEAINVTAEQVAGSTKGILDPENIQRYKESFVKGAIGGAGFGVAGGAGKGLAAKGEFKRQEADKQAGIEAEAALKAQMEAEAAAGTLTPEKQAEYDIAMENARKARQEELEATFQDLPNFLQREEELKALQARMDAARPGSQAYAELQQEIQKAQAEVEAERAKQAELDAEKAKDSAFAKVPPTPGTGGMYKPALEQQRADQQAATRQFAFGDAPVQPKGDPVTYDTLTTLKIPHRSKMADSIIGLDLETVDGRRAFIQRLENPSYTGNIDGEAYDEILATFDPKEVEAARAEMKAEALSPTKQKQQAQTRAFAFGDPNASGSVQPAARASVSVDQQPGPAEPAGADQAVERGGDVPAGAVAGKPDDGKGTQPAAITPTEVVAEEPVTPAAPAAASAAPEVPRSAFARPQLPTDLGIVQEKLGAKGVKLDPQDKDAKAYFGKVTPELALDAIANDLVYQPTAYRNAKMKLPSVSKPGTFAKEAEPMFGTKAEAEFFKGQGGIHAKNAEAWARANLSPDAIAYLDQKIAQYQKEKARSDAVRKRQQKQQDIRKNTKVQVADENAAATEEDYLPTLDEMAEARSTKTLAGKRKSSLQRLARDMARDDFSDLDDVSDTDLGNLLADADAAALYDTAHPVVLHMLEQNNLVGALQALGDSSSSETASKIAERLAGVVGNVKVVLGAERSSYDPKTNTIYLRDGATEYEILHEATHAALSHTLANKSHPVTREITNLFNQLKASLDGAYGGQDVQEFTAEAWSNPEFRDLLKQFKPDGQKFTGWQRLVNAVRRLLGFPAETAYSKLDRLMNEIVSPPPETRTGDSLYAQSLEVPNFAAKLEKALDSSLAKIPALTAERRTSVWATLEKLATPLRPLFYKSLNLSALGQVGTKYFGEKATRFSDLVNEMAGYQETLLEAMQPLHDRLADFRAKGGARYVEFSKLINDSTIPDIRPYPEAESKYRNTGKYNEYVALRNRFTKMSPEEQKLYREYFATFKALDGEFEKSLKGNLEGVVGDKDRALSAYDKIMQELASLRIDHYAPLYREGRFWLAYNVNGKPVKLLLGTQAERAAARRQAEAQGATEIEEYSRIEQFNSKNVPDGTMLSAIMKIVKDAGGGEDEINRLIQLVVQALPETSILKSRQNRTGVAGYINDNAAFVFDRVTSNSARQIARMRYSQQLKNVLGKMEEDQTKLRGDDSADAANLFADFLGRYKFAMDPQISDYAQYASTGAFYWNLAGNVSSALVNVLQTPMVALPQMGGKYGFGAAAKALNAARKMYMGSGFTRKVSELSGEQGTQRAMYSIENLVNNGKAPQYEGLIEALKNHGLLTTSTARDALHSENENSSGFGGLNKLQRVTTMAGTFMFHHAERMNREITAVAAYDLEMQRLKSSKMTEQERQEAAIREAIRTVEYAHGAGSTLAGPSLGQSDIGKILMVFKRFAFSMYYMLFDTMRRSLPVKGATGEQLEGIKAARRQLAGIYGMSALFAGAKGMPLYWVAEMAYNAFQDDDDEDFDTVMRRFLGEFIYKGPVNYFTNLSIADRVGWTDLIFREQKGDRADASAVTQFLEGLLGAPYSILKNFEKGFDQVAEGHFYRGVETMLPASIKNIMKGGRYTLEGANTLRGDPVMGDINGYNAAMQILGFAPADLMKQYEETSQIKGREGKILGQEKNLLKQYYIALREGDMERATELEAKLYELGDKYPELGIGPDKLQKSVAARDRISDKMFHGVQLNEKLRARLEGAAATAYD